MCFGRSHILLLTEYGWQSYLTKQISRWSTISFYLAVIINFLVALFYPFDKGSKLIGKHTAHTHTDSHLITFFLFYRWCNYAHFHYHLDVAVDNTGSNNTTPETTASSFFRYYYFINCSMHYNTGDSTHFITTWLYTS